MREHNLIFGFDEQMARWACQRVPWMPYHPGLRAIGVTDGPDASARLLAVCVYLNYTPPLMVDGREWYNTVEIGIAAASPRWAVRGTIINLLRQPFLEFKVRKVRLICPSTNKRAIRFAEGIGFTPEGTLRHEFAKGVHACVLGLLKSEFDQPDFLTAAWFARRRGKKANTRRPNGLDEGRGRIGAFH